MNHHHAMPAEVTPDPAPESEELARRLAALEQLRDDCGCDVGAWFSIVALVAYPVVWYLRLRPLLPSPLHAALLGIAVVLVAAGLGKYTGIRLARYRFNRGTRMLQQHFNHHERGRHA